MLGGWDDPPMDDDALRLALRDVAEDRSARTARREICSALTTGFQRLGETLRVCGHIVGPQRVDGTSPFGNGDDRIVALGYLSQTAGALVGGALELVLHGNGYAGSALNRQLVEVEYLAWAFAEDQQEAASWLRSSSDERRSRWQPRHLRERSQGRFRGADYSNHCEVGGHPTPPGMRQLLTGDLGIAEIIISETASHGTSAWDYLLLAVAVLDATDVVPANEANTVKDAEALWRRHERLGLTWQGRHQQS